MTSAAPTVVSLDSAAAVNRDVVALWTTYFAGKRVHWPLICPEPVRSGLVVVGCNPALPLRSANYYSVPLFDPNDTDQHLQDLPHLEKKARQIYHYYEPYQELAAELALPLEHIDLFFFRQTGQSAFRQIIESSPKARQFGQEQLRLALRLLNLAQPKIILVANAFAAGIFKRHFGLTNIDENGLYWVSLNQQRVPCFFSCMLSGAYPLDQYSRERLTWHMKKALQSSPRQISRCCR